MKLPLFQNSKGIVLAPLSLLAALLFSVPCLHAEVVRPAPEILWKDSAGVSQKLSKFNGQPVVVLIAPSARSWAFRSQVGQLKQIAERLGATRAICVAAFTSDLQPIRSNIPFVLAADGPRVAYDLNVQRGFALAIIGRDGNLDFITDRVTSGQRILDIIQNSFVTQELLRR